MDLKDAMAINLRRERHDRKMTQEDLADRAGLSSRYLGSIERGAVSASVNDTEDLTIRSLFPEEDETALATNAFMQGFRILCVSSRKDSECMWDRYAEGHKGIVLKISPNIDKDSKFQRFLPVVYQACRPTLYESAEAFQESGLFGDQQARIKDAMDKIVYAKTLEWEYENEYRLAIPVHGDNDWDTLSYHPEELSELYLGVNAPHNWKAEVVALAESVNPDITVYEMFYNRNGNLLSRFFH